jgi:hypothetical protein
MRFMEAEVEGCIKYMTIVTLICWDLSFLCAQFFIEIIHFEYIKRTTKVLPVWVLVP